MNVSQPVPVEALCKRCPGCQTDKMATEFFSNRARTDGLSWSCKACIKPQNAARHKTYYVKNAEQLRAKARKYGKIRKRAGSYQSRTCIEWSVV